MTTEESKDEWFIVQKRTFTKWMNNKLEKNGYNPIKDLFEDCKDGVAMISLIKSITGANIQHNPVATTIYKKSENFEYLIKFLTESGVPIVNIGPYDLVEGNEKLVLGFIWIIILRFGLTGIPEENINARKALLAWCRAVTEGYNNVDIKDFSKSWKDGLAFNAIIHKFRPDLVDYYSLNKNNPMFNITNAFDTAELNLDISKLLEPEDITEAIRPDEKSIFTYVSQYYNLFNTLEKQAIAKKRLSEFIRTLNWSLKVRNEYELRASEFSAMKKGFQNDEIEFKSITNAFTTKLIKRKEMASILNSMFLDLKALYGNIVLTNNVYNIKAYCPPEELRIENLDSGVYGDELSKFKEFEVLQQIVKTVFNENYELRIKKVEKIKQLFDLKDDIEKQIEDLKAELLNTKEIGDLIDCEEIIHKKISHLHVVNTMSSEKFNISAKSAAVFKEFDVNGRGEISMANFIACLKKLNFEVPSTLGAKASNDENSKISYKEFLVIINKIVHSEFSSSQIGNDIQEIELGKMNVSVLGLDNSEYDMITRSNDGVVDISKILEQLNI